MGRWEWPTLALAKRLRRTKPAHGRLLPSRRSSRQYGLGAHYEPPVIRTYRSYTRPPLETSGMLTSSYPILRSRNPTPARH